MTRSAVPIPFHQTGLTDSVVRCAEGSEGPSIKTTEDPRP